MVKIDKTSLMKSRSWKVHLPVLVLVAVLMSVAMHLFHATTATNVNGAFFVDSPITAAERDPLSVKPSVVMLNDPDDHNTVSSPDNNDNDNNNIMINQCPVTKIADLTPEEQHPVAGSRHMITPPQGGLMHLVCCQSTKGPFTILVHERWAPLGAKRFLEMVTSGYFNSKTTVPTTTKSPTAIHGSSGGAVPLMRCLKGFICQFGLNSDPQLSQAFHQSIPDDPNWLPEGPKHRKNKDGVKRFAKGYLAYAGGGPNTRDNQFIVSLDDVETLAGGSPWEVPWGELVGKYSFETFSKVYTGYGEDGPAQGTLWKKGITDNDRRKKFPKMDYINACSVVDQQVQVVEYSTKF